MRTLRCWCGTLTGSRRSPRPKALNALDIGMIRAITAALAQMPDMMAAEVLPYGMRRQ